MNRIKTTFKRGLILLFLGASAHFAFGQSYADLPIIEATTFKTTGECFWVWTGKAFRRTKHTAPAGTTIRLHQPTLAVVNNEVENVWRFATTATTLQVGDTVVDYKLLRLALPDATCAELTAWQRQSTEVLASITAKRLEEEKNQVRLIESTWRIEVQFTPEGIPFQAFQHNIDYAENAEDAPYYGQFMELYTAYWSNDTTRYRPDNWEIISDQDRPLPLERQWLQTDTIYVLMQSIHKLGIRAYMLEEECRKQAEIYHTNYYAVPYFYRNKASYDELYRRRLAKLNE